MQTFTITFEWGKEYDDLDPVVVVVEAETYEKATNQAREAVRAHYFGHGKEWQKPEALDDVLFAHVAFVGDLETQLVADSGTLLRVSPRPPASG